MNRKGIMAVPLVWLSVVALNAGSIFGGGFCVDSFRTRKANEKCIKEGYSVGHCETRISNMDKSKILEYIKDE